MNEGCGSTIYDRCSGIIGTFVGNTSWVAGKYGHATNFIKGAQRDRITFSPYGFYVADTDMTIIWSYKPTLDIATYHIGPNTGPLISAGQVVSKGLVFWTTYNTINLKFSANDTNNNAATTPTYAMALNEHHMIAGVAIKATRTVYLYVNGNLVGSANNNNIGSWAGSHFALGANTIYGINGIANLLYCHTRALSSSEIAFLHREPFCMFGPAKPPLAEITVTPTTTHQRHIGFRPIEGAERLRNLLRAG
jgi:hypothetical protein